MTRLRIPGLLLAALLVLTSVSCVSITDSIVNNPQAALESAGRIGSAAVKASREITQEQEIYLGRSVSARLLSQYKLLNNAKLHKYVNLVGTSVAVVSDRPDLEFHFAVLDTPEVNAFAAPGGYIFVTLGMMKSLQDEEELAAILGHEIGHACKKHSLKMIKSALWQQVAVITAEEGAKHAGVNPQLLDLFSQATDGVVGTLVTVGYEQTMEYEADSLGQTYAARAGYDARAMREQLQTMVERENKKDKTLTARLGTHPPFGERLAKLPPVSGPAPNAAAIKTRTARFITAMR